MGMALIIILIQSSINTSLDSVSSTQIGTENSEEMFNETLIQFANVNTGMTISPNTALNNPDTPSNRYVSFLVLNNTSEAIVFNDIGFSIQIFEYDVNNAEWKNVILPYKPEKRQKVLPAHLNKIDFDVLNFWEIFERDLINVTSNEMRILISGVGEQSRITYGAYVDVVFKK
jgi:hypothetical protein